MGTSLQIFIESHTNLTKKAIRIIGKKGYNYPTKELIEQYRIVKLHNCYFEELGKFMYKSMHSMLPLALDNIYIQNQYIHTYNTRNSSAPHLYAMKTNLKLNSFLIQSPKFWISIPNDIKDCKNYKTFCKKLRVHLFNMKY